MQKKRFRTLIALCCVLTLFFGLFGGLPTKAKSTNQYKELTFQDWDFMDADMKNTFWKDPVDSLTDLDGVAFTGKVTFRALENADYIVIGAKENAFNAGIRLALLKGDYRGEKFQMVYWDSTGTPHDTFLDSAAYGLDYGTAFKIRMTFEKSGENYKVNTWLNDIACNTELTVPASKLGTKLGVAGTGDNPTTIASVTVGAEPEQTPTPEETITFSDYGIADGKYSDSTGSRAQIGKLTDAPINLNGYTFKGSIKMAATGAPWIRWMKIGTAATTINTSTYDVDDGIQVVQLTDGTLKFTYKEQPAATATFTGFATEEEIAISLAFSYKSDGSIGVTVTAGDKEAQELVLPAGTSLGTNLFIRSDVWVEVKSSEKEEPEPTPTPEETITFSDYGIADGKYSDSTGTRGQIGKLTNAPANLNGYIFKGNVKFATTGAPWIRFLTIGTTATEVNTGTYDTDDGVVIRQEANGNIIFYTKATGEGNPLTFEGFQAEEKIALEVGFAYQEDGSIVISAKAGNNEAKELVLPAGTSLGTNLFVRSDVWVEIESYAEEEPEEPEPPITWQDITFSDFGIADGAYSDALGSRAQIGTFTKTAENLHGYQFKGNVKFAGTSAHWIRYIKIGTTATQVNTSTYDVEDGIQVIQLADGTMQFNCKTPEGEKQASFDGFACGEYVSVQVSFCYKKDGSIVVTVAAGGKEAKELVLPAGTSLGTNLYIRSDIEIEVLSGEETPDPEPEPDPAPDTYKELTFKDWGISDDSVIETIYKDPKNGISDLNGIAFTGMVTFRYNEDRDWLWLGAKEMGAGSGIRICMRDDDALGHHLLIVYWDSKGNTQYQFLENQDYGLRFGKEFKFRMTFYKSGKNYIVNTWVNDIAVNREITVPETKLGMKLGIAGVGDNPTTVASYPRIPKVEKTYKEYTFVDWNYGNGTVNDTVYRKAPSSLKNLDGTAFVGEIAFNYNEDRNYVHVAAKNDSMTNGIRICQRDDDNMGRHVLITYWDAKGESQHRFLEASTYGLKYGEPFKIRLTFDKEDTIMKVRIWVNDIACEGAISVPVQNLGTMLGVKGVIDFPTKIYSVGKSAPFSQEETWKNFLMSKVDLGYFGFSNKTWKRDLADICR